MTLEELIKSLRARQDAKLEERGKQDKVITDLRAALSADGQTRDPNEDEAKQLRAAQDAKASIDTELGVLAERIGELEDEQKRDEAAAKLVRDGHRAPATITREQRTYTRETGRDGVSFFRDSYAQQMYGDVGAAQRLQRHAQEIRAHGEMTQRATTTSSFAGLVVPQYLVELAALALRNGRPLANVCQHLELPSQGMSFVIPRGTTGAATAVQASENSSAQSTDEVWANLTVPVVTIAGQQDVSRQSLERGEPGLDELIYLDLAGAYAANLDSQVANGSGSSGQALGILNTASINAATAFGAAVSPTNFSLKMAGQVQAIGAAGSILTPRVVAMHPRRWGWLSAQVDSQGRPIAIANPAGPFNAAAVFGTPGAQSADGSAISLDAQFVGVLWNGLPVLTDANLPTNVGTNSEDVVLVLDNRQLLLWEDGDGAPNQLRFEQTLGNQLTVKVVVYNYVAFTAGRYPQAVGKIGGLDATGGQGLIAPTF